MMVRVCAFVACVAALLNTSGSTDIAIINDPTVPKKENKPTEVSEITAVTNVPLEPPYSRRYPRTVASGNSSHMKQIMENIKEGNEYFTALTIMFKSKQLSRAIKVQLYRNVLRYIVLNGSNIWGETLTKREEELLRQWEHRVLRGIIGGSVNIGSFTRVRSESEIFKLYGYPDIVFAAKEGKWRSPKNPHRMPGERVNHLFSPKRNKMRKRRRRPWLDGHGRVIAKP